MKPLRARAGDVPTVMDHDVALVFEDDRGEDLERLCEAERAVQAALMMLYGYARCRLRKSGPARASEAEHDNGLQVGAKALEEAAERRGYLRGRRDERTALRARAQAYDCLGGSE